MNKILRAKQIKFYTNLLKENEFLLLKSKDTFSKNHYKASPLNVLTNFSGTEGEAIIDSCGKIKIFVDSRYHILVEKQVFSDIEIYKMPFQESFLSAFKKELPKDAVLFVPYDIDFVEYLALDKMFDLRTYKLPEKFAKNQDFNRSALIFEVDKKIASNDFLYKINKFKKNNPQIEKMLVFNPDEISWLVNLRSFQNKYSSNFRSIMFLDLKNSNYILFLDKIPANIEISGLKYMKLDDFSSYINSFDSPIFVDFKEISLENYLSVKKPVEIKNKNLSLLASIRQKTEIDYLSDCYKNLDIAIFNFRKKLKEGMNEVELTELFESELRKTGAKSPSFKTILALGENSASIHYSTPDKNKILCKESLILLDCGGYWDAGYATDITRTFYFGSSPLPVHKKIYTYVLKAFCSCFLSKETNARKMDALARKILLPFEKEGFSFAHGLGHGIGTSVHQNPPRLSTVTSDIIKPYQVHSIEPGLYGKNSDNIEFGVRIENCVYTDINYKRHSLSKFPFEERLIDYSLLDEKEKEFVKNWQLEGEIYGKFENN